MRWSQIMEAPIADFGLMGDMRVRGSMDDVDRRAVLNPKWHGKLINQFRNTAQPINLYLMNAPDRKLVTQREVSTDNGTHFVPKTVHVDAFSLRDFAGSYRADDFQKTFGFLPPDYQNAINVILTQNDASDKIAMTPWITAHRIMHAVSNEATIPGGFGTKGFAFRDYSDAINEILFIISDEMKTDTYVDYTKVHLDLIPKVSTLRSARSGKIRRKGEFIIELATQAFLKGDFDFVTDGLQLPAEARQRIDEKLTFARGRLKMCYDACLGELIVF